jgi:hypothetical protein
MTKVKQFRVKPELVEAMVYGGRNGKEIVKWIEQYEEEYCVGVINGGSYISITALATNTEWRATKGNWIVRSITNKYFYVETNEIMAEQYELV